MQRYCKNLRPPRFLGIILRDLSTTLEMTYSIVIFKTYALLLHRFCVSLQRTNSKSYGKEPIKQVRLAGGNHL